MIRASMSQRVLALLLVPVAMAMVAQTPSTGWISGVVRDADTGAPLADVNVSLASRRAVTDSHGRFRFEAVEPGLTRLWAFARTNKAGSAISVLVQADQEASAEIRLKIGGNISGHVLDFAGHPVPGAVVLLLERRYRCGGLVYSPGQRAVSNEAGKYQLTGVAPGRGLRLLAKAVLKASSPDVFPSYGKREAVLLPELYPETFTLQSGETREHVDIRMLQSPAYCVEGSFDPSEATETFIRLSERLAIESAWSLTPAVIKASVEGSFRACGLHSGAYRIIASTASPGKTTSRFAGNGAALAMAEAIIADHDLRDLKLSAVSTASVTGYATFDPPPNAQPAKIQIALTRPFNGGEGYVDSIEEPANFAHGGMLIVGDRSDVPGPFNVGRRSPGDWDLRVLNLPAGCYVRRATYGTRDLVRAPLHIGETGTAEGIRLVIGCDGGSVSARVTDKNGSPIRSAALYLFEADASTPGIVAATLRRADIASGWSTPMSGLRPGKYLALVSNLDISPQAAPADEIEELWRARGDAKEVEIGPALVVQLAMTYSGDTVR